MNNFRYLGGGDFTGKVFCSTLEGRFVEVCQYVNGRRAGSLKATTRSQLEARGVDLNTMSYESITWSPASVVLNEQYGDEGLNPGGGSGMCSFHPSYPAESCPYCIEEVIVRSCQYCGARLEAGEVCDCRCDVCGSYPCKCCFYCGTYPCICESDCEICRPLPCMVVKNAAIISALAPVRRSRILEILVLMGNVTEILVHAVRFVKVLAKGIVIPELRLQLMRMHYMIQVLL